MARMPSVPVTSATKGLTLEVRVTGVRRFRARLWLGSLFVRLGTRIIGCRCQWEQGP